MKGTVSLLFLEESHFYDDCIFEFYKFCCQKKLSKTLMDMIKNKKLKIRILYYLRDMGLTMTAYINYRKNCITIVHQNYLSSFVIWGSIKMYRCDFKDSRKDKIRFFNFLLHDSHVGPRHGPYFKNIYDLLFDKSVGDHGASHTCHADATT